MPIEVSEYEILLSTRLFVLERAIGALIVTHPDPAAFARLFGAATSLAQVEQLANAKAPEASKREAAKRARELIALAEDEVARRQKGGAG